MPELCVVIPTLNEAANVAPLLARLSRTLQELDWEVIFVDDDSQDGTAGLVRRISQANPRVRAIQRIGRHGLSSACVEGMLATAAPFVAVMDGDLQHDESILPRMLEKLRDEDLDIVVGSRNVEGGSMGDFAWHRRLLSDAGKRMSALVCRCEVQDPMSGFFVVRRSFVEGAARNMSAVGFKILVDLISSSPRPPRLGEVPYRFGERRHGESKLETTVLLDFAYLIADKLVGRYVPFRFLLFGLVGLGGLVLHLGILGTLLRRGLDFLYAQTAATVAAMALNYVVNNWFTFRDRRRKGWGVLAGLASFMLACSVGALANLAIAEMLYNRGVAWYVAGALGTLVGAVWNFSVTSVFTWRERRRTLHQRAETAEQAAEQRWAELRSALGDPSLQQLAAALDLEREQEGPALARPSDRA